MLSKEEYIKRVATLGRYCYHKQGETTTLIVFSSLKKALSESQIRDIRDLLPDPVRGLWKESLLNGGPESIDCIAVAKEIGNYSYRAAAERAFETVFASISELIDDNKWAKLGSLIPLSVRKIFEQSKSCTLDGSAEDFL